MILSLEKFTTSVPPKAPKRKKGRSRIDSTTPDIHLNAGLMDLVRLRVVQILCCKSCMHAYATALAAKGETQRNMRLLNNWRIEAAFSLREKAALNLAEAVTCNPISSIPPGAIYAASPFFTEEQLILFVLEIVAINDWHYLKTFQNDAMTSRLRHK
jgi:alkylhydroperoxidase family enzyme